MSKNPFQIINECHKKGEPVFVIRAKDRASVVALEAYLLVTSYGHCNPEFMEEIKQIVNDFHLWQSQNQEDTRMPD
jgi:hypothetical protein